MGGPSIAGRLGKSRAVYPRRPAIEGSPPKRTNPMGRLASEMTGSLAREPKQDRSRASFERVLDTATALLAEKGYSEFTLQELSRRSKVSIGSVYCRVNGKDDLIRLVQVRTLDRLDVEQ